MFFVGVDSGGSKTTVLLVNEDGQTMASFDAGPGNVSVLEQGRTAKLISVISQELAKYCDLSEIRWATLGFSGMGRGRERGLAAEALKATGFRRFTLRTDVELMHAAHFGREEGILLLAGTGSILLSNLDGHSHRFGGWGYLLGDEGSGFDIGRRAIRKVLSHQEQNKPLSPMASSILKFYNSNAEDLITAVYTAENKQRMIASCSSIVCELAARGDSEAIHIIEIALGGLRMLVEKAISFTRLTTDVPIGLAGGVFDKNPFLRKLFLRQLEDLDTTFEIVHQKMSAEAAAVVQAMIQAGIEPNDEILANLRVAR